MKKLIELNLLTSKEGNHNRASYLMHTSYPPTKVVKHPSFGAITAKELGGAKEFDPIMIIDEGKLKNDAKINKLATQLYSVDRMNEDELKKLFSFYETIGIPVVSTLDTDIRFPHNSIVGNVVICQSKYL